MANTVFSTTTAVTLTGSGLIATASGTAAIAQSADFKASGKLAVEFTFNVRSTANTAAGLAAAGATYVAAGTADTRWAVKVAQSGAVYLNGSASSTGSLGALVDADKISVEIDFSTGFASVRKNGGTAVSGYVTTKYLAPAVQFNASGQQITLNAGDTAFSFAPTTGYTAGWPTGSTSAVLSTQEGVEVFAAPTTSSLVVSQLGFEVWRASADAFGSSLMVTQSAVEVWASTANAAVVAARRRHPVTVTSFGN